MKHISLLFYLALFILAVAIFRFFSTQEREVLSFYGFAESLETEINYNYPVVVKSIKVKQGQEVKGGDLLMTLRKETNTDAFEGYNLRVRQIETEAKIWEDDKKNELRKLEDELRRELAEIDGKIKQLQQSQKSKSLLYDGLQTLALNDTIVSRDSLEIIRLKAEKTDVQTSLNNSMEFVKQELKSGMQPFLQEISLLESEKLFYDTNKIKEIEVFAPHDGIVGNLMCKEGEYIPSYKTLMSFYEPHSSLVKGFVHEDLTLSVSIGDNLKISSLKDENIKYMGKVIGLGSRIVEIPLRLRKIPEVKVFGREVLIEITKDNVFLQKEKVSASYVAE